MSKSDDDLDDISSGNIDDIFSSLGSNDDSDEKDTTEDISDDMRNKYMVDDTNAEYSEATEDDKENEIVDDDRTVESDDESSIKNDERTNTDTTEEIDSDDPFKSLAEDETTKESDSDIEVETPKETKSEEPVKEETKEFDPLTSDFDDEIEDETDKVEESPKEEETDTEDKESEIPGFSDEIATDDKDSIESEEDVENEDNSTTTEFSAVDETVKENDVVIEPVSKESVKEESPVEIKDEEKAPIEETATVKAGENVDSESGFDLKHYMIESFNKRIDETLRKYTRDEILTYINKFKNDPDNKDRISDMYSTELLHYSEFMSFDTEEAKMSLWLIVGGKFADYIESMKAMGKIESSVEVKNLGKTDGEVEDPNIVEQNKHKKDMDSKYDEYKLDRTVFAIADEEEDDESSVFDDKRTLEKDFFNSPFYSLLKEVMESDRMYDMSKVQMKVVINADTAYIPVVDFSTGVRVVCIDTGDIDQYRIHPMLLSRKIPFSFGSRGNSIRLRMLYSDACTEKPEATLFALRKIIALNYLKPRRKITLANNYVIAYTTEPKYIEMFEKGDADSKMVENSTYYTPKPHNKSIGIIALDKKSERDRQAMRRNQARRDTNQLTDSDVRDYNIHFILSAEYICNDRLLVDPTIPQDSRHVEYLITQYNESNPVIVMDGLQTICACIIKEHYAKYGRSTRYSIEFECDRAGLLSPSVLSLIDDHSGLELSTFRNGNNGPLNIDRNFILPPSRLKLDGVFDFERGRVDRRFMCGATISRHYPRELVANYDLSTNDGVAEFLNSRGFKEFWEPSTVVYDVMPYVLNIIETSELMSDIHKVSLASLSDRNSTDKDTLLFAQEKLEYFKKLDKEHVGGLQRFLFGVLDMFISGEFNN